MQGGGRKTGQAMSVMLKQFEVQMKKNNRPNILFVFATGPSADNDVHKAIGDKYRAKGIRVWAYGINPQANKFIDDLNLIAYKPGYVVFGDKKSIATADRFTAIQNLIQQGNLHNLLSLTVYYLRLLYILEVTNR